MAIVPPDVAVECMQNFERIMQGDDLDTIKQCFTTSITFRTPELAEWLQSNNHLTDTVTIKVSFGVYTAAAAKQLGKPEHEGRLTAFIWPEKEGAEMATDAGDGGDGKGAPFNLGELNP
jgi:hypothetical protein